MTHHKEEDCVQKWPVAKGPKAAPTITDKVLDAIFNNGSSLNDAWDYCDWKDEVRQDVDNVINADLQSRGGVIEAVEKALKGERAKYAYEPLTKACDGVVSLLWFAEAMAEYDCSYGDDCCDAGLRRHGECVGCRARKTLAKVRS